MGFGAFSKVKSATHSLTGKKVAIKIMNRHKMKDMEEKGIFSCCPSVLIFHFLPSFMTMFVLGQCYECPTVEYTTLEWLESKE